MVGWKRTSAALCLLAAAVDATVAPNFPIKGAPDLNVTWGGNNVSPAGELLPRRDVLQRPTEITTPVWTQEGRAIIMLIDTDVPANSNTTRVPLLHWLTSNVTLPSTDTQILKLPDPSTAEVPYLAPNPPLNDIAHKYTLILFEQPENFTIPSSFNETLEKRLGFDIAAFANATRLTSALAANWIRVRNVTGDSLATPSPTASATASATGGSNSTWQTAEPYPGAGAAVEARGWVAGLSAAIGVSLMAFVL